MHCIGEMEAAMKYACILVFLVILGSAGFNGVIGAGECGKSSPDREAFKLAPCAKAAEDPNADVSGRTRIKKLGQSPGCGRACGAYTLP